MHRNKETKHNTILNYFINTNGLQPYNPSDPYHHFLYNVLSELYDKEYPWAGRWIFEGELNNNPYIYLQLGSVYTNDNGLFQSLIKGGPKPMWINSAEKEVYINNSTFQDTGIQYFPMDLTTLKLNETLEYTVALHDTVEAITPNDGLPYRVYKIESLKNTTSNISHYFLNILYIIAGILCLLWIRLTNSFVFYAIEK